MPFHMIHTWKSLLPRPFWARMDRDPSDTSPTVHGATPSTSSATMPPPSSSQQIYKYDVFISFRGTDTRNTFVDHLYNHLIRKGLFVFKDDKRLEKGKPISAQLVQAIQGSRASIVVFSKDYAASTWCLDEMATIAECYDQFVFPVFYDVDPSHVRNQNGVYENTFALHTQKHEAGKVNQWKKVMTNFGRSVGWDVRNKPEFGEIENIVQEIIKSLGHRFSKFANNLDFRYVLTTGTGTNMVKAIVLDQDKDTFECPELKAEGLSIMRGLLILVLYQKNFLGNLNFLSNSLQYLQWHGYPFASLPLNFEPYHLVELNLPNSNLGQLWEDSKDLPCLKRVDLRNSKYLFRTPNFKGCRGLEQLDFTGCTNLSQVHPSIGLLEKLTFLSFEGCSSLINLDFGTEFKLFSLRILHLSGCTELEITPEFPDISGLEYLDIDQCTSLASIHQSIGNLVDLKFLSLRDCTNLIYIPQSINSITSLITLDLYGCSRLENLPLLGQISVSAEILEDSLCLEFLIFLDLGFCNLNSIPDAIGELKCLERLNLEGNNINTLPSMLQLSRLAFLNLSHCRNLEWLPQLPSYDNTTKLGGKYFKTVSGSHNHRSGLYIFNCPSLISYCLNLAFSWMERLVKNPCHFRCGFDIVVPGIVTPGWFSNLCLGGGRARIGNFIMHDHWVGVAFCVAFEQNSSPIYSGSSNLLYLSFESENVEESFEMPISLDLNRLGDWNPRHLWLIYISRPHCHFVTRGASITFKAHSDLKILNWGLRMVLEQDVYDPDTFEANGVGYLSSDSEGESSSSSGPKLQIPYNWFLTEDVHGSSSSSSSSESKFKLPYNWFVTEEEENENIEVNTKQNDLSIWT
ncbi:hypothetical protein RJT34_29025 [Clitoria ternatea]|uniref:TIR domain-containing protein n=1 Tax=Clitoria ternatea TaxID=43366 RepID=A0AAN9FBN6_CLITE